VLNFPNQKSREAAAARLLKKAATIQDVSGDQVSWDTAARAFEDAFSSALNLNLMVENLGNKEKMRAEELIEEKYKNPEWINRI